MPVISIEYARSLYDNDDPVHNFDHVLRVLTLARRIALAEGADLEVVETAVLLHDIYRVDQDKQAAAGAAEPADHALLAAERARHILAALDPAPSEAFVEAVAHAIAAHRFRSTVKPQTLEAQVVFDADKLDATGAIGIARAYAHGARHGQRLWGEVPPGYPGAGPDHTPYHEFIYKLSHIPERLYTASGQAIARERHAYISAFFERLAREVRGEA